MAEAAQTSGKKIAVKVLGYEVIQTLQNERHEIRLIPGKPTLIRYYLKPAFPRDVTGNILANGKLRIWLSGTNKNSVKPVPSRGAVDFRGDYSPEKEAQRPHLELSLNFEVPEEFLSGAIDFELEEISGPGSDVEFEILPEKRQGTQNFEEPASAYAFYLHTLGLRYKSPGEDVHFVPDRYEFDYVRSFIYRTFPISSLTWNETVIDADPVFEPPFEFSENELVQRSWKSKINAAHMQLMAIRARNIRANSDSNKIHYLTHYYGMAFDPEDSFDGEASDVPVDGPRPETVSVGQAETHSGYYGAHEVAHTLGRLHPGFPLDEQHREEYNQVNPDEAPHYHARGLISEEPLKTPRVVNGRDNSFGHVGLDYGDDLNSMRILPREKWYDVMTYEDRLWVSDYTYDGILDRIRDESEQENSRGTQVYADPAEYIQVIGEYDASRVPPAGQLRYLIPVDRDLGDSILEEEQEDRAFAIVYAIYDSNKPRVPHYVKPVFRKSNKLLERFTSFQMTVPRMETDVPLSKLQLYVRSNSRYEWVDSIELISNKDLHNPVEKPAEKLRLVRSAIDDDSNDYFLTFNTVPMDRHGSGPVYTVQVKPLDLSDHLKLVEGARQDVEAMIEGSLSGGNENTKRHKSLEEVERHLRQYLENNRKYDYTDDNNPAWRQQPVWHTIAVDVETPKNIYLDKDLLLLDSSVFSLDFNPFKSNHNGLVLKTSPEIDRDFPNRPKKPLIAFELRIICRTGIDEKAVVSDEVRKVFIEDPRVPPESTQANLMHEDWVGQTDFVEILRKLNGEKIFEIVTGDDQQLNP